MSPNSGNPPALVDIGVNLTGSGFAPDTDAVIERARASGVSHLVLIGSDIKDSESAIALCDRFDSCVATAGIHPHHASEFDSHSIAQIRQLAIEHPARVKALGEMGLDFNRNYSTPDEQLEAFAAQLALAAELNLPVYLHQRDAHDAFLELVSQYRGRLPRAVAHCFTGTTAELHDCLDLDLHIGITGWICDERRGLGLRDTVRDIPMDRLMLETDAPYLLPRTIVPRPKSRRNEPAYLGYVLATVADCLEMEPGEVAAATTATARKFFTLG